MMSYEPNDREHVETLNLAVAARLSSCWRRCADDQRFRRSARPPGRMRPTPRRSRTSARCARWCSATVDVNAAQPDGTTALHWAVVWNNDEAVKLLLRAGANVKAREPLRRDAAVRSGQRRKRGDGRGAARSRRRSENADHRRRRDGADDRGPRRQRRRRSGCCSIAART